MHVEAQHVAGQSGAERSVADVFEHIRVFLPVASMLVNASAWQSFFPYTCAAEAACSQCRRWDTGRQTQWGRLALTSGSNTPHGDVIAAQIHESVHNGDEKGAAGFCMNTHPPAARQLPKPSVMVLCHEIGKGSTKITKEPGGDLRISTIIPASAGDRAGDRSRVAV